MEEVLVQHPRVQMWLNYQKEHGMQQKTDDWLEARRRCLTGSDVASVIHENRFRSAVQVLWNKLGKGNAFTGNEATRHGEKYEDEAIQLYEQQSGRKVFSFGLLPHQSINGLAASPDGITSCGRVIEVKVS